MSRMWRIDAQQTPSLFSASTMFSTVQRNASRPKLNAKSLSVVGSGVVLIDAFPMAYRR